MTDLFPKPAGPRRAALTRAGAVLPVAIGLSLLLAFGCSARGPATVAEPEASAAPFPTTGGTNRPERQNAPYVVLLSFDGFRPDYLDRFNLPNFRRVVERGARASAMIPVFPSFTFPNHYSLVTGLHPEHHGIVANGFYDPTRDQTYALSDRATVTDGTWYRGEPIWATAEKQGMVAGCFFWPGSEAAIGGVRPTYWKEFDRTVPHEDRVRTVLDWLAFEPARRPHMITLYFSDADSAAHRTGLGSPEVERAAQAVDRALGLLLDGLDAFPFRDRVYVVLTSDHGMVDTSSAHEIEIGSLIDLTGVRVGFDGPVTSLHVGGDVDRARKLRDRINDRLTHGTAFLRGELPERFHYRADPRAGDVVVVMDEPWLLTLPDARRVARERWGMHGWDPALPSMRALFVVTGPDIGPGSLVPAIQNVDVYPFLTELLGLTPAANIDGRPDVIRKLVSRQSTVWRLPQLR